MLSENHRAHTIAIENDMDTKWSMLRDIQGDEADKMRSNNKNMTSMTKHNGGKMKLTLVVISFKIQRTTKETSGKYLKLS